MVEALFQSVINKHKLVKKKEKVILGVSGGPDSMCMLHLFSRIQKAYKLTFLCAHLNHSLRKEADTDEAFVKKECKSLKLTCITEKRNIRKIGKGDSLEQAARNIRLDFFRNCGRIYKIKKTALAHNKDDIAETVLLNLVRGTGLKGLRGIIPLNRFKGMTLIRPLIAVPKSDIIAWLAKHGIPYRVDETNLEETYTRNKIRHTLLPLLREFNPNIVTALATLAQTAGYDYTYIASRVENAFQEARKGKGHRQVSLDLAALKKMHRCILLGVIRKSIHETKGSTRRVDFRHIEEILDLIDTRKAGSIVHLADMEVKKEERLLIIKSLIL